MFSRRNFITGIFAFLYFVSMVVSGICSRVLSSRVANIAGVAFQGILIVGSSVCSTFAWLRILRRRGRINQEEF